MKKIVAVLIVLFIVASCLFVAGTAAAKDKDKQGGHGGKKVVEEGLSDVRELSDMGDFSTGGIEGKQKVKRAEAEGTARILQSPEEFGMTQLTSDDENSVHPMFSPDGTKIAYMNRSTYKWYWSEIWVMNADGTNKYNVTDADFQCAHLEGWSPDGTKLLYRSHNDSGQPTAPINDLWLANADGSGVTQITFEVNETCFGGGVWRWGSINNVATDFSPDGSKIAFKKCNYGGESNSDLWVMDADGDHQQQLTTTPNHSEQHPKWSPDGSMILYKRCHDEDLAGWSSSDLWVINADGSDDAHVVVAGAGANVFDWSPDGEWIVWSSSHFGREEDFRDDLEDGDGNSDIYRVRANGTGITNLTQDDAYCQTEPLWFHAGCRDVIMYRDNDYYDLWVMCSDGSRATQVSPSWVGKRAYDHSPNGEWLVFQSCEWDEEWNTEEDGHTVIYTAKNPLYCPTEVPTLMPVGLIALVGLLSVIVAISIIRKRRN